MYNLLVSAGGWSGVRDTIPHGRLFEYTEPHVRDRFLSNGNIDFNALTSLPSVFLEETYDGGVNQAVWVGTITRSRISGRDIAIDYAYDPTIRPLTNSQLQNLAGELDIDDFEFSRTHWAVKEIDLFRILLKWGQVYY